MSKSSTPRHAASASEKADPLAGIREHEAEMQVLAERDDRWGAVARYFIAVANDEIPDLVDAEQAGLPKLGDSK